MLTLALYFSSTTGAEDHFLKYLLIKLSKEIRETAVIQSLQEESARDEKVN